jgi:hypothetical protein
MLHIYTSIVEGDPDGEVGHLEDLNFFYKLNNII